MPGCRSVFSFRTAFLASGSRERLALTSKEKMLHFELSSWARVSLNISKLVIEYTLLFECHYAASIWTDRCLPCRQRSMGRLVLWLWKPLPT